jgi:hypothetical protein
MNIPIMTEVSFAFLIFTSFIQQSGPIVELWFRTVQRSMIKQRQKEGIEIAKKDGKFNGCKTELVEGGK